ncbi:MAG: 30S ribosomal protein S4 [Candidatus Omnitrophota bacterium]
MARYTLASCRLCRREGAKLFLKGTKCSGEKCPFNKRSYAPGQHGQARVKLSNYGVQLREKQKVKRIYGIFEKQFRTYFKHASKTKGVTGQMLLSILECRLDNVIFRMGIAVSRNDARQIVRHGHVKVNEKRVNIPSYQIRQNDAVSVGGREKFIKKVNDTLEITKQRGMPGWIQFDPQKLSATISRLPQREDVGFPIQEQLIVELYSK